MSDAAPAKSSKKLVIVIALLMLLILGGAGGGAWYYVNQMKAEVAASKEKGPKTPEQIAQERIDTLAKAEFVEIKIVTNLRDESTFTQVVLKVAVTDPKIAALMSKLKPVIDSELLKAIRAMSRAELSAPDAIPEFAKKARDMLNRELGGSETDPKVYDVLVTDFLVSVQ